MVHRPIESLQEAGPVPAVEPMAIGVLLLGVALAGAILLTSLPPVIALGPILLGLFAAALHPSCATRRVRRGPQHTVVRPATPTERLGGHGLHRCSDRGTVSPPRTSVRFVEVTRSERTWTQPVRGSRRPSTTGHRLPGPLTHSRSAWSTPRAIRGVGACKPSPPKRPRAYGDPSQRSGPSPVGGGVGRDGRSPSFARRFRSIAGRGHGSPARAESVTRTVRCRRSSERPALRQTARGGGARVPGPNPDLAPPLVLVEPFDGLGAGRRATMKAQLEALASHHEVIVIVRSGSDSSAMADP